MRWLTGTCLIGLVLLAGPSFGQEKATPRPDGWRELIVDVSTPDDAMRILGKPSSDKANQALSILMVDKWLAGSKHNQKLFRQLVFKKPQGFAAARLSFLDDKLMLIELEAKTGDDLDWVDPDDLSRFFGVAFTPEEWHIGKRLPPLAEFEQLPKDAPPKKFAELYDMIAISERSFVLARVDNIKARPMGLFTRGCSSCANRENQKKKERDTGGAYPGQVSFIEIVSRKLEN